MQIGLTPYDPSELIRSNAGGPSSVHGADRSPGAATASTVEEGTDAAALAGRGGFDQAVRDKAASLAKGERTAAARDGARRPPADPSELTRDALQEERGRVLDHQSALMRDPASADLTEPAAGQAARAYGHAAGILETGASREIRMDV